MVSRASFYRHLSADSSSIVHADILQLDFNAADPLPRPVHILQLDFNAADPLPPLPRLVHDSEEGEGAGAGCVEAEGNSVAIQKFNRDYMKFCNSADHPRFHFNFRRSLPNQRSVFDAKLVDHLKLIAELGSSREKIGELLKSLCTVLENPRIPSSARSLTTYVPTFDRTE